MPTLVTSSQPSYQVQIDFDRRVPMRDGIMLSADVYRPRAEGRFPVVLLRTPYLKSGDGATATGHYFAERGYVLVWMDVRGRGDSDGVFVPYRNAQRSPGRMVRSGRWAAHIWRASNGWRHLSIRRISAQ